jgi:hypothetical protein
MIIYTVDVESNIQANQLNKSCSYHSKMTQCKEDILGLIFYRLETY